ncbi:unnamed protein product [Amoebophrya sp. A120]|nr:unnamed protein product [Amoebophrya sp. A120]|eukprot:GSA120T00005327001.1
MLLVRTGSSRSCSSSSSSSAGAYARARGCTSALQDPQHAKSVRCFWAGASASCNNPSYVSARDSHVCWRRRFDLEQEEVAFAYSHLDTTSAGASGGARTYHGHAEVGGGTTPTTEGCLGAKVLPDPAPAAMPPDKPVFDDSIVAANGNSSSSMSSLADLSPHSSIDENLMEKVMLTWNNTDPTSSTLGDPWVVTQLVTDGFYTLHDSLGLSWPATIVAGSFLLRISVLALQLRARGNMTKVQKQVEGAGDLQRKASRKANAGDSEGAARLISEAQRLTREVKRAKIKYGMFGVTWMGSYVSAMAALRRMAYEPWNHPSFATEQAFWFQESLALPDGVVLPSLIAALALSMLRCVYYPLLEQKARQGPVTVLGQPVDLQSFLPLLRPFGVTVCGVYVAFLSPYFSAGNTLFYLCILSYHGLQRIFEQSGFAKTYLLGETAGATDSGAAIENRGRQAIAASGLKTHRSRLTGAQPTSSNQEDTEQQVEHPPISSPLAAFMPLSMNWNKRGRYLPGGNAGADSKPASSSLSVPLALRYDVRAAHRVLEEQCAKLQLQGDALEKERHLFKTSRLWQQLFTMYQKTCERKSRHIKTFAFHKNHYQGSCKKAALFHLRQRILGYTAAATSPETIPALVRSRNRPLITARPREAPLLRGAQLAAAPEVAAHESAMAGAGY